MTNGKGKLLDTNAVIALQRGNINLQKLLIDVEIFLPSIVTGELYFGAYQSTQIASNIAVIDQLVKNRVILNCDSQTSKFYGQIKQSLKAKGRPIPENDIWIAAIAVQYNLILVSNDRHFAEINNFHVESW